MPCASLFQGVASGSPDLARTKAGYEDRLRAEGGYTFSGEGQVSMRGIKRVFQETGMDQELTTQLGPLQAKLDSNGGPLFIPLSLPFGRSEHKTLTPPPGYIEFKDFQRHVMSAILLVDILVVRQ
jgi:hypothetical protein